MLLFFLYNIDKIFLLSSTKPIVKFHTSLINIFFDFSIILESIPIPTTAINGIH